MRHLLVPLVLLAATPSCLLLEDFGKLQGEDDDDAAATTSSGVSSASVASSAASSGSSATSSAASSGGDGGATSSGSAGGGSDGGAGGATGTGGDGGDGTGGEYVDPLSQHGNVVVIRGDAEDCVVRVTDAIEIGDSIHVVGTTTSAGDDIPELGCYTYHRHSINMPGTLAEETTSWHIEYAAGVNDVIVAGGITPSQPIAAGVRPVEIASLDDRVLVAVDRTGSAGSRVGAVRDITEQNDLDWTEHTLVATGDVVVNDLVTLGGRLYALGMVDGTAHFGGECDDEAELGTFAHAGFVWSIDGGDCELVTFGTDTALLSVVADDDLLHITARGALSFGGPSTCDQDDDDEHTLTVFDADVDGAAALTCTTREALGSSELLLPSLRARVAADGDEQLFGVREDDGVYLVPREGEGAPGAPTELEGAVTLESVFALPAGKRGAVGSFTGTLAYGDLELEAADGRAGFLITSDGARATSFAIDDAATETLTVALPVGGGLLLAGQYQEGLVDQLGMSDDDDFRPADPSGTAVFMTIVPLE